MERIQDEELVKDILRTHDVLKAERAPWESAWKEIDERVNPLGAAAFNGNISPRRTHNNYDVTAMDGLERFQAAMSAVTIPAKSTYHGMKFADKDLDKLPNVRRWCERARDRLFAMRYAASTGFATQMNLDFGQLGSYGTGAVFVGVLPWKGFYYRSVHLSEIYIDEDHSGQVDRVQRLVCWDVRKIRQEYGEDALTPKMRKAIEDKKDHTEFQLLTFVRPNSDFKPDALDWRRMGYESITIATDEKLIIRRKGYRRNPFAVSRHVTSTRLKYGYSPAFKVMPSILTANEMSRTLLRAAHKGVDPALAFYDEDGIGSLMTKPGTANKGLVSPDGKLLVHAMPGGGDLPFGLEMREQERAIIKTAFLEEFFKLLSDASVQRSATAVLEIAQKQGVLIAPYAGRWETEKGNPIVQRELDAAIEYDQIEPFPPEVLEAGAYPMVEWENPLARMARAEEAAGFTRLVEVLAPMAQVDPEVFDVINTDEAAPGLANVLGVRDSWTRTPEEIAARRAQRQEDKAQAASVEQLATVAGAAADFAQAGQRMEQAA